MSKTNVFLRTKTRRFAVPSVVIAACFVAGVFTNSVAWAQTAPPAKTSQVAAIIDVSKTRQTMEGFGAATAYYQNWIAAHPNKKALYDTFFKGLNLSILRLQNVYRPTKGADFAKDDTDIVKGASAARGGKPIRILMSSWSPPANLKTNANEKGGGTLAQENGGYVYDKFADYWADSLAAYKKIGIAPTWVSLQNEPDWKADYESCLFRPQEGVDEKGVAYAGYDKAVDAAYRRFQTVPNAPQLLGPETLGIGGQRVQSYLGPANSAEVKELGGIAYHMYYGGDHQAPDTFIPTLRGIRDAYPNKPILMTEFGRSDGFQTAWCIHNTLTEGNAVAYVYWAGIWPGVDALITMDNPFNAQTTWKLPNGFVPTDRYYGLKHFSAFINPGYKRVEVGSAASAPALKLSAFVSPDKKRLVVVALNTSLTNPSALHLTLPGFSARTSAVYRSVLPPPAVTPTTGEKIGVCGPGERFRALGKFVSRTGVPLPPRSVVTVVLDR